MPADDTSQAAPSADNSPPRPAEFELTRGAFTTPDDAAKTGDAYPPALSKEDGLPSPSPADATASEGHPPASLGRIRDYELLEKLGEGGMGAVYKALHVKLKRAVAIKILPRDKLVDPQAVARFNREMEAVGQLVHPNIVLAHDAGEADGQHYLVMELVEGMDLTQLVARLGPLPIADACELVRQAALGLAHAHRFGLVHRDIKPSNLILTSAGQTKILDLGLALLNSAQPSGELTGACQMMGTADYMAPEQAADSHAVDIRADIYSLGCTLFKLLTGEPPFAGPQYKTALSKLMAHQQTIPPAVYQVRGGVPAALSNLVGRTLAKSPGERHATPEELAAALKPFCKASNLAALYARAAGQPVPAPAKQDSETASSAASALQHTNNSIESSPQPAVPPHAAPSRAVVTTTDSTSRGKTNWRGPIATAAATLILAGLAYLATKPYLPTSGPSAALEGFGSSEPSPTVVPSPNDKPDETPAPAEEPPSDKPTQVKWPTRHVDREVAERVIKAGGTVTVEPGGIPSALGDLPIRPFRIVSISLGQQQLKQEDFELIGRLRYISQLSAPFGGSINKYLQCLMHLRTLQNLAVWGGDISDEGLARLPALERLASLTVHGGTLADKAIGFISQLHELEELDLSDCTLPSSGLSSLANLRRLRRLHLKDQKITDDGLNALGAITSLRRLWAPGVELSPNGVRELAGLPHLN